MGGYLFRIFVFIGNAGRLGAFVLWKVGKLGINFGR